MVSELVKDFIETFGEEKFRKVLSLAGHHSLESGLLAVAGEEVLERMTEEEKLVFGLLEMLDYECYKYPHAPCCILTEDEIKSFLLKHREKVLKMSILPPSMLGVACGVFDFLIEEDNEQNTGKVVHYDSRRE